ncbi:hypothetical protein AN403_6086 [Pseudomonas fluorescens]|uniref:Uncharacterized protein n=1 Tax=Pseudomonas fluorescens TaxID=294 RepID=A0A0P8XXC7_PSEFL|nr:hypothetical protein AN403_6086 [Pseudomonas fluorescens]
MYDFVKYMVWLVTLLCPRTSGGFFTGSYQWFQFYRAKAPDYIRFCPSEL